MKNIFIIALFIVVITLLIFLFRLKDTPIPKIVLSLPGIGSTIDGDYLVVSDWNLQYISKLKVIDLQTNKLIKTIVLPAKSYLSGFDIYGDTVVWSDYRNEKRNVSQLLQNGLANGNADIFTFNIRTGETKQVTKNTSSQVNPRIWKNYIVWQDARKYPSAGYYGKWDIYLYDLNTGKEQCIVSSGGYSINPQINDNKVVWQDGRNFKGDEGQRGGGNLPENNTDIYMYNIRTTKEMAIATGPLQECNADISGDYIVWEDRNNGTINADIFLYDLSTNKKRQITKERHNQANPKVYGNYVAWMDERRGGSASDVFVNGQAPNADIYLLDITTNKERRITGDEVQLMPQISSKWLAFELSRQINPQIQVVKYR